MKLLHIAIITLMVFVISSCGLFTPVKLKPQSLYTITRLHFVSTPSHPATHKTLLVSLPIASSGYESSRMIYIDKSYQLKSFSDNKWVAPPAQMLLSLLTQQLRSEGYFKAVVLPPFAGSVNYHLDTQLFILQQEFLTSASFVRLVMQATLVSNTTNQVVASRDFQVMVGAPGNNPYSGVKAANKAARIMSLRISRFVVQSLRGRGP